MSPICYSTAGVAYYVAHEPETPSGSNDLLAIAGSRAGGVASRIGRYERSDPSSHYAREMEPRAEHLEMYGSRAETGGLEWSWVNAQLEKAGAYWIVTPSDDHPHPRPVWGIWRQNRLFLSIGSPKLRSNTQSDAPVTAHLGSANDVVIIEGRSAGSVTDVHAIEAYNTKYDWDYAVDEYGPFTLVEPIKVIAWRSAGWAGREGFQATGRWAFPSVTD